jgi:hypothetical protein
MHTSQAAIWQVIHQQMLHMYNWQWVQQTSPEQLASSFSSAVLRSLCAPALFYAHDMSLKQQSAMNIQQSNKATNQACPLMSDTVLFSFPIGL